MAPIQVQISTTDDSGDFDFEQKLRKWMDDPAYFAKRASWYPDFNKLELAIEGCSPGPIPSVTYRFKVIEELCNPRTSNIHGGCMILLVDDLTTVLLGAVSKPGLFSKVGATNNLRATFIRPLRTGDVARIVSEVEYFGRKRAVLKATVYRVNESGQELCAILGNDRSNTDPQVKSKI